MLWSSIKSRDAPLFPGLPFLKMLWQTLFLSLAVAVSAKHIYNAHPAFVNTERIQPCISVKENVDGALATITDCTEDANQPRPVYDWEVAFFFDAPVGTTSQQIQLRGTDKTDAARRCLEVKDGVDASGNWVQIRTCNKNNADPNQQWTSNTDSTLRWGVNANQCLDLHDGKIVNGAPLVIRPCNTLVEANSTQAWNTRAVTRIVEDARLIIGNRPLNEANCMTASSNSVNARIGLGVSYSKMSTHKAATSGVSPPSASLVSFLYLLTNASRFLAANGHVVSSLHSSRASPSRPTSASARSSPGSSSWRAPASA
ncbi:hypothetical protein MIND_00708500 [Mycena indigotica]|uniref:Ricin B lectin domain-containing protein n=1 Tax=Mycena indigotica TaxID=2126181 RepID=A0A8H6SMA1_9AGAR|nr:uncharacterized protein MIND_00708500 [Mycena indigotica]KAF7301432.1 hypothetical protein MIND_00708500 [Mycena indigotica]